MKITLGGIWEKIVPWKSGSSSQVALRLYVALLPLFVALNIWAARRVVGVIASGFLAAGVEIAVMLRRDKEGTLVGKMAGFLGIFLGSGVPRVGRLIFFFVEKRSREHVVGDLEEQYTADILPSRGYLRARCWWWWQVFGIVWPYLRRRLARVLGFEMLMGLRRR